MERLKSVSCWPAALLAVLLAASCATPPRPLPGLPTAGEGYAALYPGIEYRLERRSGARPLRAHIVRVDLLSGSLALNALAAPDPDGPGPAEAALEDPVRLARAAQARVLVNASAFTVTGREEGERPALYLRGMPADIAGLAMASGRLVSPSDPRYASIYVDAGGRPAFSARGEAPESRPSLREAAAGFAPLLSGGTLVEDRREPYEPRTAVGLDAAGRLVFVVAEGRRKGGSEGLTLGELAVFMKELGCVDALNLDGGGSSVLVIRRPTGGYAAVSRPSDGFGPFRRRRPLPNALAVVDTP